jgi:oxaloacetate decarboxylase beta subunit
MDFSFLWAGIMSVTWQQLVMYVIGGLLIYLAIEKGFEPALLMPMGFGAILVNLPLSGVIDQFSAGVGETHGIIQWLFEIGIESSEAMPLLLFIGIGAMIDFGPLLANPKLFLCGAAAQAGIFLTIIIAVMLGFDLKDAASIGIIGAADGPTSLLVSQTLRSNYVGAIAVAAYSYMALVPIIQPFAIKLATTKKDRAMRMSYRPQGVTRRLRIMFPILVTVVAGLVAPASVALVGFLMFGNLIRECGVLPTLCSTAQNDLANLITLLLGLTISFSMKAEQFIRWETFVIMCLGLVAFVLDSVVGILFVKVLNIFTPSDKINPMVGAAGISAFPMSSRVIEKLGQEADPQNHLLMHAIAANVSGQIASVVAGGVVLQYFANMG